MTKIVIISDTHNQLSQIKVPDGDILIHCGDWTMLGEPKELFKFGRDLNKLPHKHKIVIPGNHDITLDKTHPKFNKNYLKQLNFDGRTTLLIGEADTIEGISFLGISLISEIFNPYRRWGFESSLRRRKEFYENINISPTILITHSPPLGILDGHGYGCEALTEFVERVKPKYHIFGHCHEGYGTLVKDGTTYINASTCNRQYLPNNKPVVIEV